MNDIRIKGSSIKRELWIGFALLMLALGVNVYAIIIYDGHWSELFTQLHVVLILSVFFYVVAALLRGLVFAVLWLLRRRRARKPAEAG